MLLRKNAFNEYYFEKSIIDNLWSANPDAVSLLTGFSWMLYNDSCQTRNAIGRELFEIRERGSTAIALTHIYVGLICDAPDGNIKTWNGD